VPPHINTLAYPLLVHVTSTVDFQHPALRDGNYAGGRAGGFDGERTTGWTARCQYPYTPGAPDVLPGASAGGDITPAREAGGGRDGPPRGRWRRAWSLVPWFSPHHEALGSGKGGSVVDAR
jgi:hypothetical protein